MIRLDFWLAMIIVWIGSLSLLITALKFIFKEGLNYKVLALGLFAISIALALNGIFYLFYLFTGFYWIFVEALHITGIILITLGITGCCKNKNKIKKIKK